MNRQGLLLARARRRAESRMADTCTITRQSGTTKDDETGERVPTWALLYTGKCRVQQAAANAAEEDIGEDRLLILRLEVQLPIAVTGLEPGDRVTMTTSLDPDLPGRVFKVRDLGHKTEASARRVQCTEETD